MKNERKEELKDEMKNRISLALKDPILQQGFEIICKENAELKGEADSVLNNWCKGDDPCPHLKKRDEQLTKAKEIIREFVEWATWQGNSKCPSFKSIQDKAKQFLSEVEK